MNNCTIPCDDDDCTMSCHATHQPLHKKEHPDGWCQLDSQDKRLVLDITRALNR